MNRRSLSLAALLALALRPAMAIEIETVEKREERGNIGFVDMQKVFKAFPDTVRARENFEELVRQAEEQVNLRHAEVLRLRNELSQLKIQRDLVAATPVVIATPTTPAPAVAVPTFELNKQAPAPPAPLAPPASSTGTKSGGFSLPGLDKPFADSSKPEPLVINIPGVSTAPIVVLPPSEVARSSAPTLVTQVKSTAPAELVVSTAPPVNPALAELDARIALKTREYDKKNAEYKDYQTFQEKNLLDLEGRRTEILLGKISKAIQEVAHREGVSVVVDKGNIVFGHGAVDLTDKVLKHLQGTLQ